MFCNHFTNSRPSPKIVNSYLNTSYHTKLPARERTTTLNNTNNTDKQNPTIPTSKITLQINKYKSSYHHCSQVSLFEEDSTDVNKSAYIQSKTARFNSSMAKKPKKIPPEYQQIIDEKDNKIRSLTNEIRVLKTSKLKAEVEKEDTLRVMKEFANSIGKILGSLALNSSVRSKTPLSYDKKHSPYETGIIRLRGAVVNILEESNETKLMVQKALDEIQILTDEK